MTFHMDAMSIVCFKILKNLFILQLKGVHFFIAVIEQQPVFRYGTALFQIYS